MIIAITDSWRPNKKYVALIKENGYIHQVHFGQVGYEDYTTHKDKERKNRYILRHSGEDWNNIYKPGFWSRWILWNKKTIEDSIKDLEKKINHKINYII